LVGWVRIDDNSKINQKSKDTKEKTP